MRAPSFAGCSPALSAMSDAPVRGYRLVIRVVLLQVGCTLLVASLFFAFKGPSSGLAALTGGLIVAAGTALFGWRALAGQRAGFRMRGGNRNGRGRQGGVLEKSSSVHSCRSLY